MALKIIKSLKESKEVSVKNLIHAALSGWEEPRAHGLIHASELMKEKEFCPREWAFLDLGLAKKRSEFIGTSLRVTFDHGRDLEWRVRNDWLLSQAVGLWECGVCGHVHDSFGKAPKIKCPKCHWGHLWRYKEIRFEDPETGISGGFDLLLDVGNPKLHLVELKTMAPDTFKKLVAPLAEHRFRTSLYLDLVERSSIPYSNQIDTSKATILYATRSFGFKDDSLKTSGIRDSRFSPFKEFSVVKDPSILAVSRVKAKVVTTYREMLKNGGGGFPCGVCPNGLCQRAQKCSAVSPCFSGKFMGTMTWKINGAPAHPGKPCVVEVSE